MNSAETTQETFEQKLMRLLQAECTNTGRMITSITIRQHGIDGKPVAVQIEYEYSLHE